MMMCDLNPEHVRYIKCGSNGAFWPTAKTEGWIPVGFCQVPFALSANGSGDDVKAHLVEIGTAEKTASRYTTELMEFCHLPAGTIFVTFADRHLWWAEAAEEVIALDPDAYDGASRARRTKAGWSRLDKNEVPLAMDRLPTRITKTAGYRMTVCRFKADERALLLRLLNAEADPEIAKFSAKRSELRSDLTHILPRLDWRDVEQLADLIFARGGWRRVTPLGAAEMDIDLIAEEPIFGTRVWVQVKARADTGTVMDYLQRYQADGSCARFVFVCPEFRGAPSSITLPADAELWSGDVLAERVMEAGLTDWVFDRV